MIPGIRLLGHGFPLLYFGWCFIFLLQHINPAILYSSNGINIHNYVAAMHKQMTTPQDTAVYKDRSVRIQHILELTPHYLRAVAAQPGGWIQFAATLSIYVCHNAVTGALVLTGIAFLLYLLFRCYVQKFSIRRPQLLSLIPPFFVLTICAWYDPYYLSFLLPVAGALGFAILFVRLRRAASARSPVLWLSLLFWSSWYLLQWGSLLLLLLVIVHELIVHKRATVPVIIAAGLNALLLLVADLRFLPTEMTIHWQDFAEQSGMPLIMIGYFPLAALIHAAWNRQRRLNPGTETVSRMFVRAIVSMCIIVAAIVWLYADPVNRDTRTIARTVYHVYNRNWNAVLHENTAALFRGFPRKAGALQAFMVHAVDRALCNTGRLGNDIFTFPQAVFSYDPLLMLKTTLKNGHVNWVMVLDLAMDLGMVNTAEKIAGEIMENMGPYPEIVYRRALIQIAKGNREAADVYLKKLSGMPFFRKEARRLLAAGNDALLLSEPRIATMRANMDKADYFLFATSEESTLKHLLQSNPGNKAAYDYLMTFCLLTGQLDGISALAPAASLFGYSELPRNWEEALCVHQAAKAPEREVEVSFYGIRPETVDRFNMFAQSYRQLLNDPTASDKLAPAFGESYFYFSIFRHSHGTSHD
jgi:hypothetical protein